MIDLLLFPATSGFLPPSIQSIDAPLLLKQFEQKFIRL